jgi:hypothetical protein
MRAWDQWKPNRTPRRLGDSNKFGGATGGLALIFMASHLAGAQLRVEGGERQSEFPRWRAAFCFARKG